MPFPLPRLRSHFGTIYTDAQLEQVDGILVGAIDPMTYPGVQKWVSACYNEPRRSELVMEALNEALGMHGVEAIQEGPDATCYAPQATYLNTGVAYGATILYIPSLNVYRLTSWGDYVESLG